VDFFADRMEHNDAEKKLLSETQRLAETERTKTQQKLIKIEEQKIVSRRKAA